MFFHRLSVSDRDCMKAIRRERKREREQKHEAGNSRGSSSRVTEGERVRQILQFVERHLHPPAGHSAAELTLLVLLEPWAVIRMDPGRSIQHEISSLKGTPLTYFTFWSLRLLSSTSYDRLFFPQSLTSKNFLTAWTEHKQV